ncbi:unnamed protein product [Linum trigynum]|uniref:Uncharacterized protein n=1 Tax=Linum trigynum TaxID=586398 RepID=A0AAV2DC53_9ROSI
MAYKTRPNPIITNHAHFLGSPLEGPQFTSDPSPAGGSQGEKTSETLIRYSFHFEFQPFPFHLHLAATTVLADLLYLSAAVTTKQTAADERLLTSDDHDDTIISKFRPARLSSISIRVR